jgi:2-thiouracil desulfurase
VLSLVIGAPAVAYHARPRATKDLDIWLDPRPANARKALTALRQFFGGADLDYMVEDVTDPDCILQLGVAPVRIDALSAIPGCPDFQAAWKRRVDGRFGGVPTQDIGLTDLIGNKEATSRAQDRPDAGVQGKYADRYSEGSNLVLLAPDVAAACASDHLARWAEESRIVPFCPEVEGGLSIPRLPAEIDPGATAEEVLAGRARIRRRDGEDVTAAFLRGARRAGEAALTAGARLAGGHLPGFTAPAVECR